MKNKEVYEKLGFAIKSQRKKSGITQIQMCHLLRLGNIEISAQQLQKYESGINRMPVVVLLEICKILNVNIKTILEWSKGKTIE